MHIRLAYGLILAALAHATHANDAAGDWQRDAHTSSTISFNNAEFTLSGPNNVYAHVEQPAPQSAFFRASASIKAPDAAELSPSVFVYWAPDTWVRIGYISGNDIYHVHGPGVYGIVSEKGKESRYRLTTTNSADWTYFAESGVLIPTATETRWNKVAVLVTENELYFQIAGKDQPWESVQKISRSGTLKNPPAKIIVGKGHYSPTHTAPDLDNSLADAGPVTTATIRNVHVEPVEPTEAVVAEKPGEHYLDVFGQAELEKPGDPTYDSVASHWPALQYGRDALSVPNHPHEFAVLPDGQIGMWPAPDTFPAAGKGNKAWFTVGPEKVRFGGGTTVSRSLQQNYLPILTCGYQLNGLNYKKTIAGWSEGMSPDGELYALVKMEIVNETSAPASTSLRVFGENEKSDLCTWDSISLAPAEAKTFYSSIRFPSDGTSLTVQKIEPGIYDARLAEVSKAWEEVVSRGMQISIPEPRVMDAWRAWLMWLYIGVDKVNGNYEFHDGAGGFYELIYGISATRASQIMDFLNRTDDSRLWIDAMLTKVDKDGLFLVNSGLPDQGALMQTIAHHYNATKDKEWLRKVAPTLLKMCQWTKASRATAKAATPTTSPVYGMIKARPYCDHPQPEYYIISDVYVANGLRYAAEALAEIGMSDDAAWVRAEADSYIKDIHQVLERSVFEVDGFKLLPMFPETRELLRATGWMGSNYYSLLAPYLLDQGGHAVPSDSIYTEIIVEILEKRGGLLMGLCRFWGGIDHAYTAGYWYDRLIKGEPEKALLGLYASMAYGMSRDTFSSVEVTFAKDGKNFQTLPHNYSNQEQLRLLRNLLVVETTDTLYLGAGISRHWLASGQPVEVRKAGSLWGDLSYTIVSESPASIKMKLEPPAATPPGGIRIFFRHPAGKQIEQAQVIGAHVMRQDSESVTIRPTAPDVTVTTTYR